ncbi:DMT family transporter [Nisaea nitritireducens]|uniref:DMT family transporter n=1 Tax=Nisaea nitritireducens TaxID=568392 RepID=UPI001867F2BC|nr:DMT family transporter [Nisaea nitritireducens]
MPTTIVKSAVDVEFPRIGVAFGLMAAVIWGGFLVVSRHGVVLGLEAVDIAFLRYVSAALVMLPILLRQPGRGELVQLGWFKPLMLAMLAGPLFLVVGASGFYFAPAAHAAVIQPGGMTLTSVCFAAILFGERLTPAKLAGLALLVIGLATIAGPDLFSGQSEAWKGDILFATAGTMFAGFTILVRRWRISAWTSTAIVSVLSGFLFGPLYLMVWGPERLLATPFEAIVEQVVVQGILSAVVALFAFARAVHHLGPGRASFFPAMAPSMAILIAIPVLGEFPSILQWAGLAIATLGLVIALRRPA